MIENLNWVSCYSLEPVSRLLASRSLETLEFIYDPPTKQVGLKLNQIITEDSWVYLPSSKGSRGVPKVTKSSSLSLSDTMMLTTSKEAAEGQTRYPSAKVTPGKGRHQVAKVVNTSFISTVNYYFCKIKALKTNIPTILSSLTCVLFIYQPQPVKWLKINQHLFWVMSLSRVLSKRL